MARRKGPSARDRAEIASGKASAADRREVLGKLRGRRPRKRK